MAGMVIPLSLFYCQAAYRIGSDPQLGFGTPYQQGRGLKEFASVKGGKTKEYVDISSLPDVAMRQIHQIPKGRQNGCHLGPKLPCRRNQPLRRSLRPDLIAILTPRSC
jgi:hypothetical protein